MDDLFLESGDILPENRYKPTKNLWEATEKHNHTGPAFIESLDTLTDILLLLFKDL